LIIKQESLSFNLITVIYSPG